MLGNFELTRESVSALVGRGLRRSSVRLKAMKIVCTSADVPEQVT